MRPHRAAALLLCALTAACAPRSARKPVEATPADPADPLRKLLARTYSALGRGEVDEVTSAFTQSVVAFGPAPADSLQGREPVTDELRRRLMPLTFGGGRLHVTSSAPKIGLAKGGKSAWLWDLPTVERVKEGKGVLPYKVRLTAHAVEEAGSWAIDAVHLSVGLTDEELFKPGAPKTLGLPRDAAEERGLGTAPLVELLNLVLKDQAAKIERTSDRDEVVLIGTGPAELFEGGKKFKEWGRGMLPQLKKAVVKLKVDGPITARLAPDGETGFIATTLSLTLGAGRKAQTLPPFRSLWVFVKEGDAWSVVEDHESSGVPQSMWTPEQPAEPAAPDAGR
ncbi:MAG: nuclear transport factor 2 family protein [Myxococcaceae bacterium]